MLLEIDKCKSKRKVAENINTSIDTVNKYLRNLEQNMGLQLIINNTSGCRLTSRAQKIAEKMRDISDILEQIYLLHPENNRYKGDVSVCLPQVVSSRISPQSMRDFFNEYPELRINAITAIDSPDYEKQGADLAIVCNSSYDTKHYSCLYKKQMPLGLFAAPDYLQKYGRPADIKDLISNHRIAGLDICRNIDDWRLVVDKARHCLFNTNSDETLVNALKSGMCIGIMPQNKNIEGLIRIDELLEGSSLNLDLIANNNTKNIPRVRIVADYYRNLLAMM